MKDKGDPPGVEGLPGAFVHSSASVSGGVGNLHPPSASFAQVGSDVGAVRFVVPEVQILFLIFFYFYKRVFDPN